MSGLLGLRLLNRISKTNTSSNFRRWIATSNKKSDVSATATSESVSAEACPVKEEKRHWQSYGFSETNELDDLNQMHNHGFFTISLGLVFAFFIFCYRPETDMANWAQREAFLELRRREKLGLPLIDPNLVDPANIVLPTDEELGSTEIII